MPLPRLATLLRLLALVGLAGLAALVSNGLAGPARRLAWRVPPVVVASPAREPAAPQLATPPPGGVPPREPAAPAMAPLAGREGVEGKVKTQPVRISTPTPPTATAAYEPIVPMREVGSAEALTAFQAGWSFLDARRSAEFAEGHVRGAFCAPVWEADLEDRLLDFKVARHPGAGDPIVIYCSGGDCHDSHLLAEKLLAQGYVHLLIYRDGYPDWVAQGRLTAKGAQP